MPNSKVTTIRRRILAMVAVPLAVLLAGGIAIVTDKAADRSLAREMHANVRCFEAASGLVASAQRERGKSALFLGGKLSRSELLDQRRETDQRAAAFAAALAASALDEDAKSAGSPERLRIEAIRGQVVEVGGDWDPVGRKYTEAIAEVAKTMRAIANRPTTGGVGKGLTSLLVVEGAKESAGLLRATLSGILSQDAAVPTERVVAVIDLRAKVLAGISSQALALSPESTRRLSEMPADPRWMEVERVVAVVTARSTAGAYGVDPNAFWQEITGVVDDLGVVVTTEVGSLLARTEEIEGEAFAGMVGYGIGVAVLVVLMILFAWLMAERIARPLRHVASLMAEIADGDGDLTRRIEVTSRDETGELAGAFNRFAERVEQIVARIARHAAQVSTAAAELSSVSTQTAVSVRTMNDRTTAIAASAEEASANTASVAASMDQAAASLSSVATATEEMSATIGEVAAGAERARSVSAEAGSQAAAVSGIVVRLGEAAREIGAVTETITNISSQTNLLALNATIEAARAGAAGKGFAVVANEIKDLAKQTAAATEEIRAKIGGVQGAADDAIEDIRRITSVTREVDEIVSSIATAIEEQAVVTRDVATNIAQASAGVRDANERVTQTAEVSRSMARDLAAMSAASVELRGGGEQVQASALAMTELSARLGDLVGRFRFEERQSPDGAAARPSADLQSGQLIPWSERLSVGVASMDAHHKRLVGLVNDLHAALRERKGQAVTARLLKELLAYVAYHFRAEEELMERAGYAGLAAQRAAHTHFVEKAESLKRRWDSGDSTVPAELMNVLRGWLVDHITVMDKKYEPFVR